VTWSEGTPRRKAVRRAREDPRPAVAGEKTTRKEQASTKETVRTASLARGVKEAGEQKATGKGEPCERERKAQKREVEEANAGKERAERKEASTPGAQPTAKEQPKEAKKETTRWDTEGGTQRWREPAKPTTPPANEEAGNQERPAEKETERQCM